MTRTPTRTERLRAWFEHPRSALPAPSADGSTVYVVSDRDGLPRAWTVPAAGGDPTLFARTDERVGRVHPSPYADRVVLATDVGGNERWELGLWDPQGTAVRRITHDPTRIHEPGAWRDDRRYVFRSNARDERFFDVCEVDLARPDPPRRIREEDATVQVVAARGDRLVLGRACTNLDTDLLLRVDGKESLLNPRESEMVVFGADLGPGAVYAAANPDREFAALVRYRDPGSPELLYEPSGDVEIVRVDPSGRRVALVVNDRGYSRLVVHDLTTSESTEAALPVEGVIGSGAWRTDGAGFLFDLSAPALGTEVFAWAGGPERPRRLTRAPRPLPGPADPPTLEEFAAEDGLRVAYWEHRPRGATRGTVVLVHGGPESQARPGFSPFVQFLVGEGFRTVVPNVRGSLGYGRTYVHLDDVRLRRDSVRDLRDLVGALRARDPPPLGGPYPLGIIGGSYGGFMVLAAITTYPELFAAAVDIVGIANFVTFLERTGPWRRKHREHEYGRLDRDREFLRSISPLHAADRIRTPLLVVHGANDPRVPIYEAEQIVASLRGREVPVDFLRFEDEGHGLVRRDNQVRAYARAADFFEQYLARTSQGETPPGPAAPAGASPADRSPKRRRPARGKR